MNQLVGWLTILVIFIVNSDQKGINPFHINARIAKMNIHKDACDIERNGNGKVYDGRNVGS